MDAEDECQLLFVPVRESGSGMLALRAGRLPSGQRVGLGFTSEASLLSVLGPRQPWIRLHEDALRDMLVPIGVDQIKVDARLQAAPRSAALDPQRVPASATPPSPAAAGPRYQVPLERRASLAPARPVSVCTAGKARQGRAAACTQPTRQPRTRT